MYYKKHMIFRKKAERKARELDNLRKRHIKVINQIQQKYNAEIVIVQAELKTIVTRVCLKSRFHLPSSHFLMAKISFF